MTVVIVPDNREVSHLFSAGMSLRAILRALGILEQEVICIDRKRHRLLLPYSKIEEDSDWEIRRVLSQG